MAVKDFTSLAGTSTTFSATADVLALAGDPSGFRFDEVGSTVVVTRVSDSVAVTLSGVSQEEFTSSNLIFSGSSANAIFGDGLATTSADNNPNTITNGNVGITATNLDLNNLIYGLGAGDVITVGNGSNVIFGGMGPIDSADGADDINLGFGSNYVVANGGADDIDWNTVVAAGQSATVYGGQGNDSIGTTGAGDAHAGNLLIFGNGESDNIDVRLATSTSNITIYGGSAGVDTTDGADTIVAGLGNALVIANAGNDTISTTGVLAASKAQTIYGGVGNDTYTGGNAASGSSVIVYGNAGTDTISLAAAVTSGANATIYGGDSATDTADGADTISTGNANVLLYANAGADVITVGTIAASNLQTLYLGLDNDTVNAFGGAVAGSLNVIAGAGNDTVSDTNANTGAITVDGGEGNDVITFSGANTGTSTTSLVGGEGTDTITIGAFVGAVTISGGAGVDTVTTGALSNAATAKAYIDLGDGADVITLGAHGAASLTTILGGEGADSIVATASGGSHTIEGGAGNDTIKGGSAVDSIDGGADNDSILGAAGNDILLGGAGTDSINGGAGADTMTGGDGADVFQFASAADANVAAVDKIKDFIAGTDDWDTDFVTTATNFTFSTQTVNTGGALTLNTGSNGVHLITGVTLTEANATTGGQAAVDAAVIAAISNGTINISAASAAFYLAVQTASQTFLYQVTAAAGNALITTADDDLVPVAIFDSTVTLTTGDII